MDVASGSDPIWFFVDNIIDGVSNCKVDSNVIGTCINVE